MLIREAITGFSRAKPAPVMSLNRGRPAKKNVRSCLSGLWQKIFKGFSLARSENGLKTHSILPSLVQTARRQGVLPRKVLERLLIADAATAQAALYSNSS